MIGFALLALSTLTNKKERTLSLDWRKRPYTAPLGMTAISYLLFVRHTQTPSSIPLLGLHGPRDVLTFGWDILAVALLSLGDLRLRRLESRLAVEAGPARTSVDELAESEAEGAEDDGGDFDGPLLEHEKQDDADHQDARERVGRLMLIQMLRNRLAG